MKRSNVIKADNVSLNTEPRCIPLRIPMIENGSTSDQMIIKMREDLDELLDEFCHGEVNIDAALAEMFDVMQVMAGYILAKTNETILSGDAAHDFIKSRMANANDRHIHKLMQYAGERGWRVLQR